MNEPQRDLRQAAEEAFQESLERLQQSLLLSENEQEPDALSEVPLPIPSEPPIAQATPGISLDDLEDAVKDIEAFLSNQDISLGKLL